MTARALTLSVAAAALLAAAPATAAPPRASFNAVESQLMCDTCNVPLAVADSPRADQERREIRSLIAQGLTEQQILDRFHAEYGANVLAKPTGGGSAVTVWAIPTGVVALGAIAVALLLPRWRRGRAAEATAGPAATPPELNAADALRLEQDLARYDP